MTLKNATLERAENFDEKTRADYNLPDEGLVIIESISDPNLRMDIVPIGEDGIRGYLRRFGEFKDTP